jgi:hypothetical protein
MHLMAIYGKLKKRPGRAKVLASTLVQLKDGRVAKLVFVRDKRKKDWLALLSTDTALSDADVVRIYGKRWDIEVFFKMAKQHLVSAIARSLGCLPFSPPPRVSDAISLSRLSLNIKKPPCMLQERHLLTDALMLIY